MRSVLRARAWSTLGVALAVALAVLGCEQSTPPRVGSNDAPDQEVRNFTLTETVDGRLQWRMTARSAATYRDRGVIVARDVAIDFFDDGAQVYSHLVAREGEVHTANHDMEARGDVVITTTSGTRVETEALRYSNTEERIRSDHLVTVRRGGDVLSGVGFESDPSLENFEFRERVRAKVQTQSGRLRVRERGTTP